jgi:hypothetical protein
LELAQPNDPNNRKTLLYSRKYPIKKLKRKPFKKSFHVLFTLKLLSIEISIAFPRIKKHL